MIKYVIKSVLRRFGLELHRYDPYGSQHCATHTILKNFGINVVFDVGANIGTYGEELFASGYKGKVISFEPLSVAYAKLKRRAKSYPNWLVHTRSAVGGETGQVIMNVSANTASSSVFPILPAQTDIVPEAAYVSTETVPLIRLDDVASKYTGEASAILLKADTQGFEWHVLDGAKELLRKVAAVQLELSVVPLYRGQRLWREYVDRLEAEGFQLYFLFPAMSNPFNGQTLQWDGMFVREEPRLSD
jgi:FkbM family methyltransferase